MNARPWSALGLFGVGRGMRSFKDTPQEELELEVLAADLELQHRRKVQAAGYRLPFDITTWWREQLQRAQRMEEAR